MRKFMVVVDETPECSQAMRFAARRAQSTGGGVVMLYVIEPEDFQHWMGVAEVMRAEAFETAEDRLAELAEEMKSYSGHVPEMVIREGTRPEQVLTLIEQDREIGVLVLGSGSGSEGEGPGPLVTHVVTKMAGRMPIPVTVVPGQLSMDEIDSVC
ncbi:MAG: universal stress protein [Pseudomonadota bacterium]